MQTANGYQPTPTEVMSYWVDNMEKEARELFRRGLPLNTDIWDLFVSVISEHMFPQIRSIYAGIHDPPFVATNLDRSDMVLDDLQR